MAPKEPPQCNSGEPLSEQKLKTGTATSLSLLALHRELRKLAKMQVDAMLSLGVVTQEKRRYLTRKQFQHMSRTLSLQEKQQLVELMNAEDESIITPPSAKNSD